MARTQPHHDWTPPSAAGAGAEWESLRNELVALLDHVEDQVKSNQPLAKAAIPAPTAAPAPPPAPGSEPVIQTASSAVDRHHQALRSVRLAVDRLAERNEGVEPPARRREDITNAINQIRARQGARPAESQPVPTHAPDIAGLAGAIAAVSARIESFETKVAARIDALGDPAEVAAQVSQLSEVVELLANAVGESGQVKRLEAQLVHLAETLGADRGRDGVAARIEELAATVEKLTVHQIQMSDRDDAAGARFDGGMSRVEESVRAIHERIAAIEAREDTAPQSLIERIDALTAKIDAVAAPSSTDADAMRESIEALRGVVLDAIAPRFGDLEARIDDLGTQMGKPQSDNAAIAAIETQLRAIAAKVEETGAQLQAMAQSQSLAGRPDLPDLSALADLVAERTREAMPDGVASVGKTDLAALEDRLSKLFARAEAAPQDGEKLEGMKASIDRVDTRLERLEATLNGHGAPRTRTEQLPPVETEEIELKTAPKRRRGPASDTMPTDPVAEPTQTVAPKAPMPDAQAVRAAVGQEAAASEPAPFRIDPETIERPVKPQSSLDKTPETGFEAERRAEEPKRAAPPAMPPSVDAGPTVSRASFIEAARRAARQQADTAEPEEPKSLIGRAMARFQRSEAELVGDKDEKVPPAREAAPEPQLRSTPDSDADAEVDDRPKGFFARNKRPLLLSTALVIVLALAGNLVMQRLGANNANASQPATASVTAPEAAPTAEPEIAPEPATSEPAAAPAQEVSTAPASAVSEGLMSAQPLASQNADLAAGRPDAATMLEGIDPIQTASIGAEPIRYIPLAGRAAAEPVPTTQLPVISVPQDIGPAELRSAAEGGDARAQFEVGAILTEGHVVEQDFEAAAAWYERAAAQGFAPAQYRLGSLYEGGRGVERDLDQARLWYQQAAEAGNRMSMHNLASLYASGELGDQDFGAAAHWFEEAAARGLTDSQFNLGMLYARGLGVEQDFEQSYFWFTLAAEAGDEDAVGARDDVARSLDADAIQRIQSELSDWAPAEIEIATNFAPIGTWSESFDPGEAIANRDVVMRVQMILGKLGYEVGEPDGVVGPMTRDAIRGFERQAGMSESGVVNPRLLAVLGSQPV